MEGTMEDTMEDTLEDTMEDTRNRHGDLTIKFCSPCLFPVSSVPP